jgi:polar amino acid transport system permease protein
VLVLGVLVLSVVYAAYCSEVYPGALITIPPGIDDACVALRLPTRVVRLKVLLPLAIH